MRNKNILKGTRIFLIAGALIGSSLVAQTVYAEDADYATVENILNADPVYFGEPIEAEQDPFVEFDGEITSDNQFFEYMYTAPKDGDYYFSLENLNDGSFVRFNLYDSYGNEIHSNLFDRKNPLYITLEEGETYTIQITNSLDDVTPFSILILPPREPVDITETAIVQESFEWEKQRNEYSYTAPRDGYYYFSFSDTTANVYYGLKVYDQNDTEIINTYTNTNWDISWGAHLEEGETYNIWVEYNNGLGKYTLKILEQKPTIDITGYTDVNDSMEYNYQYNYYLLEAPVSGEYSFRFLPSGGFSGYLYSIENEYGSEMASSDLDASMWTTGEKEVILNLDEGEKYYIELREYEGFGDYTLKINYPSSAQQYLESFSMGVTDADYGNETTQEVQVSEEDSSTEDPLLQQLEALQSELEDLKEENELLHRTMEEYEIEFE